MQSQDDGQDFSDQQNELQQALSRWEETTRTFETNYYRLQWALETPSLFRAELVRLRDQSITYLETLYQEIAEESATPERLLATILAQTQVLDHHNQQVSGTLKRFNE